MIRIGPVGRTSDRAWDDGGKEKIVQIFIAHGDFIYSLQYLYVDQNGNLVLSDSHGTAASQTYKFDVVKLDYPSEFITGISGCYGHPSANSRMQILSITFTTNNRTYGPFGGPGFGSKFDSPFRYQLGLDRPFGGFHGYSGHYLEAIGLYVKPLTTLSNDQEKVKNEKV
ncbi:inactive protein RESTRICTED TEV MOVEMENT 1-like isoform X1 [Rhododendron vialii]|uniref:inactive protein RESTRICTED TEV MOVEMENT 1-like isoform X1 n=1 Tax=Rhododendron vialii TaxID=182163 RepID=UPI00265DAD75|nr:inactive protein RESTRICTED TEV MOVEMENT 1-like isoform X1 [Rhododendron vialii]